MSNDFDNDFDIVLTRKDGSVKNFRIYGRPGANKGDVITLPVDGQVVKARIGEPLPGSEISQSADQTPAFEV
jgi:hypothetical protein